MSTDEAIEAIEKILEAHVPGSFSNGLKMFAFLTRKAEEEHEAVQDAMSARE